LAQQALLGGGSGIESDSKTNWEAHNVVNYAKLKEQYRVSELANDVVDSITQTGALPSNYITKSQARAMGWSEGKTLNNCVPGKVLVEMFLQILMGFYLVQMEEYGMRRM